MLMIGSPVMAALLTDSPIVLHANDGMLVPPVMFRAVAVLCDPGLGRRVRTAGVHEASGDNTADHRAPVALHGLQRDASLPKLLTRILDYEHEFRCHRKTNTTSPFTGPDYEMGLRSRGFAWLLLSISIKGSLLRDLCS